MVFHILKDGISKDQMSLVSLINLASVVIHSLNVFFIRKDQLSESEVTLVIQAISVE